MILIARGTAEDAQRANNMTSFDRPCEVAFGGLGADISVDPGDRLNGADITPNEPARIAKIQIRSSALSIEGKTPSYSLSRHPPRHKSRTGCVSKPSISSQSALPR
jgi:hypothetical protein